MGKSERMSATMIAIFNPLVLMEQNSFPEKGAKLKRVRGLNAICMENIFWFVCRITIYLYGEFIFSRLRYVVRLLVSGALCVETHGGGGLWLAAGATIITTAAAAAALAGGCVLCFL